MCFKKMIKWEEKKLKKMDIYDIKLVKISVLGFTLMLAKLFPELLVLDWYWYLIIGVIAMLRPMKKLFKK